MEDLQLNDPITITSSDGNDLEGVVAHVGTVQFASGPDWVGIRLTGTSVGKGKNDGSVKGVKYFNVPDKNGMFVQKGKVKKRELNRLEKLRLKRELAEGVGGGSATTTNAAAASSTRVTRSSAEGASTVRSPVASQTSPIRTPSATAGGGGSSKLEELRAKREALAKERAGQSSSTRGASSKSSISTPTPIAKKSDEIKEQKVDGDEGVSDEKEKTDEKGDDSKVEDNNENTAPPSSDTPSKINLQSATPGYRAELARLQNKISSLEIDLKKKTTECTSLQSSLDFMSKGAEQSTHDAVR